MRDHSKMTFKGDKRPTYQYARMMAELVQDSQQQMASGDYAEAMESHIRLEDTVSDFVRDYPECRTSPEIAETED